MRGIHIDCPFQERPFVSRSLAKIGPPRTWNVLAGRFGFGLAAYAASASAVIAVTASGSQPDDVATPGFDDAALVLVAEAEVEGQVPASAPRVLAVDRIDTASGASAPRNRRSRTTAERPA